MPPKTERSPSLPNKPPRISTRSRATAQALPTPQQPSPPLPSTPVPAVTARRDSDSQAPMPLPTQDSDPQPTQEQANTPRATVSSPSTSSSVRQTARRDTRTNRRASQSSTTNTVSPGPSDPQQPPEEHARSSTPVSESGEATEFRMPTRSHSVDSSLAEPSEDPSQPGGRRKSTRLTAPVAEPNENEPPPPDTINTPKRRKGGRGASAKANGLLPGKAKNPAEYDESDDSEVEVAAPKLSREEKKARREALLQERLAELDTMQRQVEEGTHPGFRQELDDIETKRRRKLQIAQTRLEYTRVSTRKFFHAAEKQAFDDFAVFSYFIRFIVSCFALLYRVLYEAVTALQKKKEKKKPLGY
ncbi:hypothetical protein BC938DRAFT_478043 [Jimgerdemannia flammicorona]|uniref:Uncharacterized protein n=1 Tax=Jimgerdemannia flammicorona TaxID=994334 RepID=A0A433QYM5_9FUNG|nr:hypothetical protein BC938DRAFT_478043 [Jimgerdemannia flammicorona]